MASDSPAGFVDLSRHAVGGLAECRELGRQPQLDPGMRLHQLERFLDDLDTLALQDVGEAGIVLEMSVVELGDQLALVAVPIMEQGRDDAARFELVVKPDALEQFERRGMVGAGPRHLFEKVVVAERFDQTDRDALLRQCQRQAQPDRPGADDDHAVGGSIHASRAVSVRHPRA